MICGFVVDYPDEGVEFKCIYCSRIEEGHIKCPAGHYVCDSCHNRDSLEKALEYMKKGFDIVFPESKKIKCSHSEKHPHGFRELKCPYYERE